MLYNCVLARFSGEFGVKSGQTKGLLEGLLRNNLKNALLANGKKDLLNRLKIIGRLGRYYLVPDSATNKDIEDLVFAAGKMFGFSSISPCVQVSMNDKSNLVIVPAKLMVSHNLYPGIVGIKSIGVKVDEDKWKSEISLACKKVSSGKKILDAKSWDVSPWALKVDKKLEIEVFEKNAYISAERIKSPGGFPLGLEDSLVTLISGGIDSPVAAWMAMKRGAPLIILIMDTCTESYSLQKKKALLEAKVLLDYMKGYPEQKVIVVPYNKALKELSIAGEAKGITCLMCKRLMYRVAENIAYIFGAKGIVTGEILGEQASQTLQNISVLSSAIGLPIFRPLFCFDKSEVIDKSKQIGTDFVFGISQDPCFAVPKKPAIRGDAEEVKKIEKTIDIDGLVSYCVSNMKELSIKEIDECINHS